MAVPDALTIVRNRTTDDIEELSDDKINEFLEQHADNVDLATAEALEYMARTDRYNSESRGNVSTSGPTLMAKAAIYRTRGENTVADTLEQDRIRTGTMKRGDIDPGDCSPEYSGYTWPNGIFS